MPTAAFTTLGCKVNQYETQRIIESFETAGFDIVPFEASADVYVVNSCSVTSVAESKSRYTIRKASRTNPTAKVLVTGCAAQMAINKGEEVPGAHLLVPNPSKLESLRYLLEAFPSLEKALCKTRHRVETHRGRTRATLKIQDGCNICCSYCSIPYTRPIMTSRPAAEVHAEAARLAQEGYLEAVLTGVLIGAYGEETGSGGPGFEELVETLARSSGLKRIRISSIEMRQVTPALIDLIKDGLVAPHLHIPLQSGDSEVLRNMNRPYTQDDYLHLCKTLYHEVPGISLTTDIMVGFPTETLERFESTIHVCHEARFLKSHVFRFSPRYGTPADAWGDAVDAQEKVRRSLAVQEITRVTGKAHTRQFIGQTLQVITEGKQRKDGLLEGLTDNYLPVHFAGPTSLMGTLCHIRVLEEAEDGLLGELSTSERPSTILRMIR
jgi:threonylcarbamoyladenosine tRNA methylthiotransferase MtaB